MIIEGRISVKAAIQAGNRKVDTLYLEAKHQDKDIAYIKKIATEKEIPIVLATKEEIETLAIGRTHGGILAKVQPRQFQELPDLYQNENPFVAVIEGVEDPYNLGYILRSLYSSGCTGLILRKRNWEEVEPIILKASAGAYDYMPIYLSEDVASTVHALKAEGLYCYAAMRKDAIKYTEANFTKPMVLLIGGELRGLSSQVRQESQQNIYIPYANDFRNALNAAAASAVLGFEVMRQRER